MSNYGATELFVSNFVGIQEELQQLFGAQGSVQEFWISQKKGVKVPVGTPGLYGVVRWASTSLFVPDPVLLLAVTLRASYHDFS